MTHSGGPTRARTSPPSARRQPPAWVTLAASLGAAVALSACDRAAQQEAGVEASAAAALKAQGARDARFEVHGGDVKATITQPDGREQQVEIGAQAVKADEFGLPYYPGAAPDASRSSRMSSADGQVSTVVLATPDPPAQVLTFYRDQAQRRTQAGAGPSLEIPDASGAASIVIAEDASGRATQVRVEPVGAGSEITLLSTQRRGP